MPELPAAPVRPRLRGVFHQWACAYAVPLGLVLLIVAGTARPRIALSVYALSLVGLFGASALYHRISWRVVTACDWMRRIDYAMIFVLIAGSYTPFAMLVLHGPLALAILVAVWAGAGGMRLLGLGGVFYTLGAVVYAVKRPDPGAIRVRISRSLPHPRDRGGRPPVRGDRLLDPRVGNLGLIKEAPGRAARVAEWLWLGAGGDSA